MWVPWAKTQDSRRMARNLPTVSGIAERMAPRLRRWGLDPARRGS